MSPWTTSALISTYQSSRSPSFSQLFYSSLVYFPALSVHPFYVFLEKGLQIKMTLLALDYILYYFLFSTCKIVRNFYFFHFKFLLIKNWRLLLFFYFFGELECVLCYATHFLFLKEVWIRTRRAAVSSRLATNIATHFPTQPPISLLSHKSPYLATHLSTWPPISLLGHPLATHLPTQPPISLFSGTLLPTQPPISLLSHQSPYLATNLPTQPPISLFSHPSPYLADHIPSQPPFSLRSHPSPYVATHLPTQPPISLNSQPPTLYLAISLFLAFL